jgi:hypothetical protein
MPNNAPPTSIPSTNSSGHSTPSVSDGGSSAHDGGYFAQFGFEQDTNATFITNFKRLAITQGWSNKEAKSRRPEALEAEFDAHVGTDVTKLEGWQRMCKNCRIEPVPSSITQCKKVCNCQDPILDACLSNCRLLRRSISTSTTTWIIVATQSAFLCVSFAVSWSFGNTAFLAVYILSIVQRKIRSSRRCFVLSFSSVTG